MKLISLKKKSWKKIRSTSNKIGNLKRIEDVLFYPILIFQFWSMYIYSLYWIRLRNNSRFNAKPQNQRNNDIQFWICQNNAVLMKASYEQLHNWLLHISVGLLKQELHWTINSSSERKHITNWIIVNHFDFLLIAFVFS